MSIALIGVIVIQFLWIGNAVRIKQQEFNRSVNTAMLDVSKDLEEACSISIFATRLRSDSVSRAEVIESDSDFYNYMVDVNKQKEDKKAADLDRAEAEADANGRAADHKEKYKQFKSISISNNGSKRQVVTVIKTGDGKQKDVLVTNTVMGIEPAAPPAPPEPPAIQTVPTAVEMEAMAKRKDRLIQAVCNVADDYAISRIKVTDLVDSGKINEAIQKEFSRQHLPANFVFGVYCADGDTMIINKASADAWPLHDYAYKSPLLPSGFVDQKTLLLINIPYKARFIFSSLSGMFMLSLLFTLTIIATFAYSLHVIFRQKKLSEITNDFINNMTHELKTPLATISMTADTMALREVSGNPSMVDEYSGMIKGEVKKLSRHVDRILEAAVGERNTKSSMKEAVSLNKLIEDELKTFEPLVMKRGGNIAAKLPQTSPAVYANADLLRGVLCNLLDNALKYSTDTPAILITLQLTAQGALISVADNGIGISKANQKLIFEKFYRAHTGNRHDVKGFGLGLSFAKGVVENMGGRIWVESEPGKGSTFNIELPTI